MAKKGNDSAKNGRAYQSKGKPKSPAIFERGISTDTDAIKASFAAAADVGFQRMTPAASNAMAGHVRNALKIAIARYQYAGASNGKKSLLLT